MVPSNTLRNTAQHALRRVDPVYRAAVAVYRSWCKGDLARCRHAASRGHVFRRLAVQHFLRESQTRVLQIGGGHHVVQGWLNGDLIAGDIYLDATHHLPLPDASLDYVFAEQFIEHITYQQGQCLFQELRRVLRPGGVVRVATPDLERLALVYQDMNSNVPRAEWIRRHVENHNREAHTAAQVLNDFFRMWGHRFLYDEETLRLLLNGVGFESIVRCGFGESKHPTLQGREVHANEAWMRNAFVLILEATRPAL